MFKHLNSHDNIRWYIRWCYSVYYIVSYEIYQNISIILLEYMVLYESPMLLACAIFSRKLYIRAASICALRIVVANLHQYVFALLFHVIYTMA